MSAFNRNIIVEQDVQNLQQDRPGRTLEVRPPAAVATGGAEGSPQFRADDYLTRVIKTVPPEALALYLTIEGLVLANTDVAGERATWLLALLVASLAATVVYMRKKLTVVRSSQVLLGALGLGVYVFATGGWFATLSWYEGWHGSVVLVVFAALLGAVPAKPLPAVETSSEPDSPSDQQTTLEKSS